MKIKNYKTIQEPYMDFYFNEIVFGNLNLIVGFSSSGKTRLLNTLFNLGVSVSRSEITHRGNWDLVFTIKEKTYSYKIKAEDIEQGKPKIASEELKDLSANKMLIQRQSGKFLFNGEKMPELKENESGISILQNEPEIRPIYQSFQSIIKRNFSTGDKNYAEMLAPEMINHNVSNLIKSEYFKMQDIHKFRTSLNIALYALKIKFPVKFMQFKNFLLDLFDSFIDLDIKDISEIVEDSKNFDAPILCIKEKGIDKWIPIYELSSGMQKVIIIMTDVLTTGENWIYLIDEYENSLGPRIMDFLFDWIDFTETNIQLIITTHHPYIINKIPQSNWYLCTRNGKEVKFYYGEELEKIIGKSHHSSFNKLLNNSLYGKKF